MLSGWTTERVTQLAPDQTSAKDARKLAALNKWQSIGADTVSAWGEVKGSGAKPYQVKIDLARLIAGEKPDSCASCTCPSRKAPCKHCLALLYLLVEQPAAIPKTAPPPFLTEWLEKIAQRAQKDAAKKKRVEAGDTPIDPAKRAKALAERQARIMEGLQELDLWLTNLIRHGLADPQVEQRSAWNAKALRMIDAQAPGVATALQTVGSMVKIGDQWAENVLAGLGRIELFIQGFKHYDTLPEAIQADLRAAAGWYYKKDEVSDVELVADRWLVIGQRIMPAEDKLRVQRLWLRGESTGRDALIMEFAYKEATFETILSAGQVIEGKLAFFPSTVPLRAFIAERTASAEVETPVAVQGATIPASITAYSAAFARNPWLSEYPMLLEGVTPLRHSSGWWLHATDGVALPLAPNFQQKWSLLALSGGAPIRVFGEWDGTNFYPLATLAAERLVDFNLIGRLV
jgi:hypothetical protein